MLFFIGTLIFLLLLTIIVIRFMGKSALAQFTPHDLAALFFIITLAIKPIQVKGVSQAVIGIVIVIVVHIVLTKLSLYRLLNRYVIGEPTILIKHGKLIKKNLESSRLSLRELVSSIRNKGYPDIADIQYAILEPNGEISVLPKEDTLPVTPKLLDHQVTYQGLPLAVVIEGNIQFHNLKLINKDEKWLRKELEAAGYSKLNTIFYASVRDTNHSLKVDDGKGNLGSI
ncbi:DUF421 domain-containing protein [Metabacillus arenae]|uniref:DUF421 domain-containing protein n=1 Tax=Metabacillus arenae TaxID=2771434 RepID=A0A926NI87_9BACI|nr:DUF421 domain-containing protein [Metabacillus arenae]MBD1381028.1 DUF421 domain-containing protein [Metabacillus arenae]